MDLSVQNQSQAFINKSVFDELGIFKPEFINRLDDCVILVH